ncbi:alternative oxidase, mitochondrial [Cryptococcus amylolentus CBS 6273]|uniref:Alternative oxidase n=1 Tax=Cryptococcus amylolentus CBS 6273 TaxID=1296118 RepID=A0A1E3JAG0_9TREE|nr:alternative oxidase, mitochondrial [Cryptococcus amylolentus CBS 6273]
MSTLTIRTIMARPMLSTSRIMCARSFTSTRTLSQATQLRHNSLSLQPRAREADERRHETTVGSEGKGVEGPHPKGKCFESHQTSVNALSDATGPWTLFNPIYTDKELNTVQVIERTPVTAGDKVAKGIVKSLRRVFDVITRYTPYEVPESVLKQNPIPIAQLRADGKLLSDHKWLFRIILLESVAGVPGMVGGTLRHLRSMRLLKRDGGWIHTLLEEAENERMHLLTFMTIAQPNWLTRALVLAAQGVFYNAFFLTYLFSPKVAHRFVAALEEEAVRTYTHCVKDMESGLIPEWQDKPAPRIAIDYWRLPSDAKLIDVIKAVRADEATHRFVNHSLANLDQKRDFNPFALAEASPEDRGLKWGYTREESALFAQRQQQKLIEESTQQTH